jgi:glycosyltransferase involved in cell wall biosynthesis
MDWSKIFDGGVPPERYGTHEKHLVSPKDQKQGSRKPLLYEVKYRLLMACIGGRRRRRISAMIRVRNEEEFLYPSIKSIADAVDEIIIVDNLSTDRSALIIESLRLEYPHKVVSYQYPYEVRKVGGETWELAVSAEARSSPHLSANYYNWCLRRCTEPFVLKWDGDMIATGAFYRSIEEWRLLNMPVMIFNGANVHPDLQHLIAAESSDRENLLASLKGPWLPAWVTSLSYDYPEPRLFPRCLARYDSSNGWTQRLSSPYLDQFGSRCCYRVNDVGYLHMKFCKRDPYAGYSSDLKEVIASNVTVGPPLSPECRELLRRWLLNPYPV